MSRGVLMSKKGRRAVLLTKDGAFKRVKLRRTVHVLIGEEVFLHHLSKPPAHDRQKWLAMVAICLSLIFIFVLTGGADMPQASAAAYVSFDINPSVEVSIDDHLRIIRVQPLNHSAEALLGSVEQYSNMSLDSFTEKLADKMTSKGYLENHPELVVTTTVTGTIKTKEKTSIISGISHALKHLEQKKVFDSGNGVIRMLTSTEKNRKIALSKGLSAGKYLIYKKAVHQQPSLTLKKAKTLSVKELDHFQQTQQASTKPLKKLKPVKPVKPVKTQSDSKKILVHHSSHHIISKQNQVSKPSEKVKTSNRQLPKPVSKTKVRSAANGSPVKKKLPKEKTDGNRHHKSFHPPNYLNSRKHADQHGNAKTKDENKRHDKKSDNLSHGPHKKSFDSSH